MGKVRVVFAIPSLQAGGMERVMAELINYFSQKTEIELHVILYGRVREIFYRLPKNINLHKPDFRFDDYSRLWATLKTIRYLRNNINALKPEAVLSFGEYWNNLVLLATFGLPFSIYVSDRSQPDKPLGRVQDILRKLLYPKSAGVIAQTERARQIYQRLYHHKRMTVIGNPIRKIEPENKHAPVEKLNQVLMVGRLIRSKHQDELIKIFAQINMPGWQLVLVGDDHLKQHNRIELEYLIHELGMKDKIILVGKRVDVEHFYLSSKIFAFTSSSEGFPNVIGEAMSAGLPVVAYDCVAGPSEMIKDGVNGFLAPLHDIEIFVQRLKWLMEHPQEANQMGHAAQASIQRFSSEAIGEEFFKFITSKP